MQVLTFYWKSYYKEQNQLFSYPFYENIVRAGNQGDDHCKNK